MTGARRLRDWWSARRRFEFCLTVAMVMALTGVCVALLMLPNAVLPKPRAAQPGATEAVGQAAAADPRLAEVRRIVEPFGPIVARRVPTGDGRQSLVVGHPAQQVEIEILERELAAAITGVTDVWGPGWAQSALVVVASSPSEFAALLRSGALLPTEVAAASIADPLTPGAQPTGQRVVFGPDAGRRLDPAGMATLLRHELTHIAARADTVDGAPLWMLEGFADYTANHGQGRRFADIAPTVTAHAGEIPEDLPTDAEFSGPDAALAYEKAWSICAFVAEKYDRARLVQLYHRIAAAEQDPASEDHVLREVLGTTRTDFITDWRSWLTAQTT
ncbi:hypothetical protein OHA40_05800 [Nocardia sp. NBC_00508]|uniref:hypothetical protein n=1 Tax=Nocardia sp. NBC_00508 TaxID=2975992 RepID=UPI002E81435F|nr:hypothetical protein [Nocardia sp. NBC_00508]WUD67642.1 hypothetical protein OHA40_05800 [Nocardia sp. NBC_00508]